MKIKYIAIIAALIALAGCASTPPTQPEPTPAPTPVSQPAQPQTPAVSQLPDGAIELDDAIREASDYLNDNVPGGNMIVVLNIQSVSEPLSDYVIDELIANTVNDRVFLAVDRQQLDLIRAEHDFQLSGSVDEKLAVSIGRFFGAQTIVSGRVRKLGDRYRMTISALDVETAQIQGQYNRNNITGQRITELMENPSGGKEIKNTLAAVKAANEGDYIILKSGEKYVFTYDEIDIANGNFNYNDLSDIPAQIDADGAKTQTISEAHTIKVFTDNQSAHLLKTARSFNDYMKYIEDKFYQGRYIDAYRNYNDFEPISPRPSSLFSAIVRIQTYSNGADSVEQYLIRAYNYQGRNFIMRYFSTNYGWVWGNTSWINSKPYEPVGESHDINFGDE